MIGSSNSSWTGTRGTRRKRARLARRPRASCEGGSIGRCGLSSVVCPEQSAPAASWRQNVRAPALLASMIRILIFAMTSPHWLRIFAPRRCRGPLRHHATDRVSDYSVVPNPWAACTRPHSAGGGFHSPAERILSPPFSRIAQISARPNRELGPRASDAGGRTKPLGSLESILLLVYLPERLVGSATRQYWPNSRMRLRLVQLPGCPDQVHSTWSHRSGSRDGSSGFHPGSSCSASVCAR